MPIPKCAWTFVLAASIASCLPSQVTEPTLVGEGKRVLFIGNSYLYTQDLPSIVQAFADSAGGDKLAIETVAGANMALVDHWFEGAARREIAKGGWAWVVLQQGPSSRAVNRDSLRLMTKWFSDDIAKVSAKPALFSAWPSIENLPDFPRAIESYQLAASDVGGIYLPVAAAWLAAWKRDSTLALYSDGLHPSQTGGYLSALVIYAALLEKSPVGLPSKLRLRTGRSIAIEPDVAELLQAAAAEAVAK